MGVVANLVVRVSANVSDFEKQIASLENGMAKTGSRLQSTGAKLTAGLTLPIVALAGASIKAAMDFEEAFSGVAKTVDGVADSKGKLTEFGKQLQQGFRELSKTIPVTVNELAKIGETAGALGIPKDKVLEFSAVMAKLGATTNVTSDQAAASIGAIQNVFKSSGVDTDRFASSLVALGNAGASTEAQILAFAERMTGAARDAGVAQSEMLGWANAMASVGINAELGSTAWNKVMSSIGMAVDMGSEKLAGFAAVAGMTSQSFSNLFKADASEAMNRVVEGFGRVKASGGNLTGTMIDLGMKTSGIQMTFKNLANAGDLVRNSLDLGKKAWQDNVAMEEEFTKKSATTISQLKVLYNRLYDVAISLGQQLLPAFTRMAPAIEAVLGGLVRAVQWFSQLPQPIQTGAIALVGLVAALGPVTYAIGTVLTTGGALLTLFRTLGLTTGFATMLQMVTPYALGARVAIGSLYAVAAAHPFIAITAAVGGLIFALDKLSGAWDNAVQAKQKGGWKAVIGELGRNVNDDSLSFFKDWRVDQQTPRAPFGPGMGGTLGGGDPVADMIKAAEDSKRQMAAASKLRPDLFPGVTTPNAPTPPKQKTAAQREAEAWQASIDKLSGQAAITAADEWMKKVQQIGGATKMAAENQKAFHTALDESIDAMLRLGRAIPSGMLNEWVRGLSPGVTNGIAPSQMPGQQMGIPTITNLPGLFGMPAPVTGLSSLPGQQMARPTPPPVSLGAQIFGTAEQVGSKIGDAFAFAVTRSRSLGQFFSNLGGSIGGMLGEDLGKHLGGMASKLGGWVGGALGSALPVIGGMLGSLVGPLVDKLFGPTEYEQRTRAAAADRAEIRKSMDMPELQRQAAFTGRQDLLTGITSGLATNNDPEYIRSLLADLQGKTEALQAAMDRYGISWEQLGVKAKQSQIDQMAIQFIADFQLLTQAGAEVDLVIEKMSGSVNEFVQTALRTGTEVPIAMQPMLQKMVDMGILIDANGVALTDLSSITWAESMTQGFTKVADAINHLAMALGYELPKAARTATDGMNAEFSRLRVPGVSVDSKGYAPSEMPELDVPQMARGGYVPARAGGTLVNVGEGGRGEYIVPEGKSVASGGGGGDGYMPVTLQMEGETFLKAMVAVRKSGRLHL